MARGPVRSFPERALRKRWRRRRRIQYRPLQLELLEDRQLLSTVSWTNPAGGNWDQAANWKDDTGANRVPTNADDVVIDLSGADYTVTLNVDATVASVRLNSSNATLSLSSRTITVDGQANLDAGNLNLLSSAWSGAGRLANDAAILVQGSSIISSPFDQNGSLLLQGLQFGCCSVPLPN